MHKRTITPVALLICLSFLIYSCTSKEEKLKKDGVTTTGTIITGEHLYNNKGDNKYDVTVQFSTKEGRSLTIKEEINSEEYRRLHEGQTVDLVYSKKDPTTIKLLVTNDALEKYLGIKNRAIEVEDLTKLLDMNQDSVGSFLNTVSYKWVKRDSSWLNERNSQFVKLNRHEGQLTYAALDASFTEFPAKLKKANFRMLGADSTNKTMKLFESDSYFAAVALNIKEGTAFSTLTLRKK